MYNSRQIKLAACLTEKRRAVYLLQGLTQLKRSGRSSQVRDLGGAPRCSREESVAESAGIRGGAAAMEAEGRVPRVGVGVLVLNHAHWILVGRRRSSVGDSKFALPGGHLEFGESWEECAAREVREETGLTIQNIKFAGVTNTVMLNERRPSHYVTIFMQGELADSSQEAQNLESDKCHGWEWVEWPKVHHPVFEPLQHLIDSGYKVK